MCEGAQVWKGGENWKHIPATSFLVVIFTVFLNSPFDYSSNWRQQSVDDHGELGDINADINSFRSTWTKYIQENKQKWKERAASGMDELHLRRCGMDGLGLEEM